MASIMLNNFVKIIFILFLHSMSAVDFKFPILSADNSESFFNGDKEFVIHNLPARWEDALIICRGHDNGSLAVFDELEKAKYLAEAISESDFSIDSIWIGARRSSNQDPDGFRWVTGTKIDVNSMIDDSQFKENQDEFVMETHFPLWLNRSNVISNEGGGDCVAMARMLHDHPLFMDLPCEAKRLFVCEKKAKTQVNVAEAKTVRCQNSIYQVYNGKMNWEQAAAYCIMRNMTLANVNTAKCLKKIGYSMLRARPSIESAWVGSRGDIGDWFWKEYSNGPASSDISGSSSWLPSSNPRRSSENSCVLLDRHTSGSPIFLEERCERKLSFVCQETSSRGNAASPKTAPYSDEWHYYILVHQKLTWRRAYVNCQTMNGVLAPVTSHDVVTQLLLIMAENQDLPVDHIWVSGRLNMTRDPISDRVKYLWYNPATGRDIPVDKHELWTTDPESNGYVPPWLAEEFTTDNPCLNLDRENQISGVVYGLPCNTAQFSICIISKPQPSTMKAVWIDVTTAIETTTVTIKPTTLPTTTNRTV